MRNELSVYLVLGMLIAMGCSDGERLAQENARLQEMGFQEAEMDRYEAQVSAIRAGLSKRFDRNKDGRLEGAEQIAFDRYLQNVKAGREANPFAAVASPGSGGTS